MKKRKEKEVDLDVAFDLIERGVSKGEIAKELGVSVATLSGKLAHLRERHGILTEYRALQSMQLTELQYRVLEKITDDKIAEAPLRDLVYAFKTLKSQELTAEGKPSEIKGLVAYLIEMEKQESLKLKGMGTETEVSDAEEVTEADFNTAAEFCSDVETDGRYLELQ